MKKLIKIIDFVLEQNEQCISSTNRTYNYAIFLKQLLEKWMFVPCKLVCGVWIVLEKPKQYEGALEFAIGKDYDDALEYQEAEKRCLFKGFEIYKGNPYNYNKARAFTEDYVEEKWTIEKIIHWDLELTDSAIKQSGL